jgi:hypothetical protein
VRYHDVAGEEVIHVVSTTGRKAASIKGLAVSLESQDFSSNNEVKAW